MKENKSGQKRAIEGDLNHSALLSGVMLLLEQRMGLAAEALGSELIARIVQRHMAGSGLNDENEYFARLQKKDELWKSLVEAVVIPETWFFRNSESFAFLSRHVRSEWMAKARKDTFRILSVPCATGEEPYSIAMSLIDEAIPEARFQIEAMDISSSLLKKAEHGHYGMESFRGQSLGFRERYFDAEPGGFQLKRSIMSTVRFFEGNLLEGVYPSQGKPYDAIFCRNLLIYLTPQARKQVADLLARLLDKEGIIFVGHSEREVFGDLGFERIRQPGVFAYRRVEHLRDRRGRARSGSSEADPAISAARVRAREIAVVPCQLPGASFTSRGEEARRESGESSRLADKAGGRKEEEETNRVAVREASRDEGSLLDAARNLADRGLLQDALELCSELLRRNALHADGHFLRALVCLALNDRRAAAVDFNRAAYLDPGNDEALDYLAWIAEKDGDRAGAAQLRQRAERIRARRKQD